MPTTQTSAKAGSRPGDARSPGAKPAHVERATAGDQRDADQQQQLRLQAPGAQQALAAICASARRARRAARSKMRWPSRRRTERRPFDAAQQIARATEVERDAAGQRQQAHQQRRGEAVPDGQAVFGCRRPEHGAYRRIQERANRDRRNNHRRSRQASTRTSTGKRIQRGGSCGVRGSSVGAGPKNTSRMKRSE